jgi:hypothetical protein
MTKKLEELFNLDDQEASKPEETAQVEKPEKDIAAHQEIRSLDDSARAIQKITGDLPQVTELDEIEEKDLDHLATKAEQAYDDLMDLGMNVEVRYSGRIFEVASSMLKNAIDAKTAKVDKKLKAIDLKLKKYKIDKDSPEDPNDIMDGQGYVMLDRNELMKKLGGKE